MADILTASNVYQGTFTPGTIVSEAHYQVCAIASINASNQLQATVWVNQNGERVNSNLGNMNYRIRDKAGALVSGLTQTGVTPDINGYYHITPVLASLIYDLTHYTMEIEIDVDGVDVGSSIGLVVGE